VIDLDGPTPLYQQVAAEIRERIAQGTYRPGRRIPSSAALAEEFGVSRRTVVEALRLLREAGDIVGVPGRGTFVNTAQNNKHPGQPED